MTDEQASQLKNCCSGVESLAKAIDRINVALFTGDPDGRFAGLIPEVRELKKASAVADAEREKNKILMRGIAIGLGFTSVTTISGLAAVIAKLFGAP